MNWRAVIIVLAIAIPIILVGIILIKSSVDEIDSTCKNETCVRYCNKTVYDFSGLNFSQNLKQPYQILESLECFNTFEENATHEIKFLENGHVDDRGRQVSWKHYCIDKMDEIYFYRFCYLPHETELIRDLYPYFMLASLPFLIITLLVYGCIKDLRNIHGKCLMAYVSSLTVMYITLIFNGLGFEEFHKNHNAACITIGYTLLTSVLCCFFWLNVMCYDIYRAFRVEIRTESKGQFIKFCAYAFGIPVVYMTIVFILNFFEFIPEDYNNKVGIGSCSINSNSDNSYPDIVHWIYIYGPILLLISINIIFYGVTAWKFFCVERERTRLCRTSTSRIHHGQENSENRTRFLCYLRLSVIMGVPWIIEILSFSLGSSLLFAASIFNCMQGFVVFITFVWHPRVTKHIKKRCNELLERNNYPPLRSRIDLTERNDQLHGSADTLVDGPCYEQTPEVDECIQREDYVETNQNLRVFGELNEKLTRMS